MTETDTMYSRGKIYKIISPSHPELVYYGSTCTELYKRFHGHKTVSNKSNSKLIVCYDDAKIILVETYPCNTRNELQAKEYEYIIANECINKQGKGLNIENRKEYMKDYLKEYNKKYYVENKDKIKENMKEYYTENKDKIKENMKDYQLQNKEKLKEYQKEYKQKNNL